MEMSTNKLVAAALAHSLQGKRKSAWMAKLGLAPKSGEEATPVEGAPEEGLTEDELQRLAAMAGPEAG